MGFTLIVLIYIVLVVIVSMTSSQKGLLLTWASILLIPTIILEQKYSLPLPLQTVILFITVLSGLAHKEVLNLWPEFIKRNGVALFLFTIVSIAIVFLSQTVPLKAQFLSIISEFVVFSFAIHSYLVVQSNPEVIIPLRRLVCGAIIFNIVFCIIFEVILRFNPAGMPLYILLGVDDNQFIVDMIETERGLLEFRAQTIYRHPLSLGQYMLILTPLFLHKENKVTNYLFIGLLFILIVLSGSRGAIFPFLIIILIYQIRNLRSLITNSIIIVPLVLFTLLVFQTIGNSNRDQTIESFIASIQFWDDDTKSRNNIHGSSMELRINQFEAAQQEIVDNPLFGRGYGYREYWHYLHHDLHPKLLGYESIILYYLVERGWVGLIFFFGVLLYLYKLFKTDSSNIDTIPLFFIGFILSIIMTGIRPLSLLFLFLSCIIESTYPSMLIDESEEEFLEEEID